jgi:bacteriocin biosynthesis cyclodehydratase domain-containing protein
MNSAVLQLPDGAGIHLIVGGSFGRAVGEQLESVWPGTVRTVIGAQGWPAGASASWPPARLRILVSGRDEPQLTEILDDRSYAWHTPWFPVILDHPRLRFGPIVTPGVGACHHCFDARRRQHEPARSAGRELQNFYREHPLIGPEGWLPAHVALAAAMIRATVPAVLTSENRTDLGGRVRQLHLLDLTATSAVVTGVHGCSRCGTPRPNPDRTWKPIADAFAGPVRHG